MSMGSRLERESEFRVFNDTARQLIDRSRRSQILTYFFPGPCVGLELAI